MSISSDQRKIKKSLDFYEEYLKTLNDEVFLYSPDAETWSFSEIYSHVLWVAASSLIAIEQCLNKTATIKSNPVNWKVRLILFLGILPGRNLKAPEIAISNVKKISKEDALNKLIGLKKRLDLVSSFKKYDEKYKVKHPILGWLDAKLWLRFILVHTKHHIKQLSRLEKRLDN